MEIELAGRGRVLLRASGTEPLVRVMVEAEDEEAAHAAAQRLCAVVEKVLVASPSSRGTEQQTGTRPGQASHARGRVGPRRTRPSPATP